MSQTLENLQVIRRAIEDLRKTALKVLRELSFLQAKFNQREDGKKTRSQGVQWF